MVNIDEEATNFGIIDGVPQSFGQEISIIQKTNYQANSFIVRKFISEEQKFRFSAYHLDIV
jgi:hypothetical protein